MSMRGGPGGFGRGFMSEEEKASAPKVTKELVLRVLSYLKPYWKQMALVLIAIIVSSSFNLLPSILTGKIIDEGLIRRDLRALIFYIVLSLAANGLSVVPFLAPL
ncbi:MAG: hypothetical protein IIV88_04025, partial [Erysipelotrichaceae bacterium]|nr:hypothetical protein [Erysipelotrichaceae bacterium]